MAAYCVSPFNAIERAWKPFNPILGETFELEVGQGVKYLAEQVGPLFPHPHLPHKAAGLLFAEREARRKESAMRPA